MRRRQAILGATTAVAGFAGCNKRKIVPSALSDKEAKKRALEAEEDYLYDNLQNATCLTSWGTSATTVSKEATVLERTQDGIRVDVIHPYWFSTNDTEADSSSHAEYIVTTDSAQRISGDQIDPC